MENNEKSIVLRVGKDGNPLKDTENCERIFLNDPDLKGKFKYNEREDNIYKFGALPWDKETKERPFRDVDLDYLLSYFCKYQLSTKWVENALRIVADKNKYEPLQDYFKSLDGKHDGVSRAETLFIDCLGAEDTLYTREATKLFLKACVSRTMQPGCKYDYMIILVGEQGIGKSTLLSKICPDIKYYTDSIPNFKKDKKFVEAIEGKLICETAELASLNKSKIEDMKACISSVVDRARSAYARKTRDFLRRCVFVGTTNLNEYLRDETGNRRFLPIKCEKSRKSREIWAEDFDEYREQIWAEAYKLYKEMVEDKGVSLVLPVSVRQQAAEEQSNAMEKDEWHSLIEQYICNKILRECGKRQSKEIVSIDILPIELYENAIGGYAKDYSKREARRVGAFFTLHPEYQKVSSVRVRDNLGQERRGRGYRLVGTVAELKARADGLPGFKVVQDEEAAAIDEVFLKSCNI